MNIWDMIFGGGNSNTDNSSSSSKPGLFSDPAGTYLGNLIDPNTTEQYKMARLSQGLLGLGAGLGALGPSRLPVPLAQSVASGAQGLMKAHNDLGAETLQASQTGTQIAEQGLNKAKISQLQQDMKLIDQMTELGKQFFLGGGVAGGTGNTGDTAIKPIDLTKGLLAGNSGFGSPTTTDADLALIRQHEASNNYFIGTGQKPGTTDLLNAPLDKYGAPIWDGNGKNSHAFGGYQFQPGTWKDTVNKYFDGYLDWRVPANQDAVAAKLKQDQGWSPWAPYNKTLAAAIVARGNAPASAEPAAASGSSSPPAAPATLMAAAASGRPPIAGPDYTGVNVMGAIPKPGSGLPVMSSQAVFGTPTPPPNAGQIVPPAIPNYGVPGPGQSLMNMVGGKMAAVPPGYQPPSPLAGAAAAIPGPPPGTPAVIAQGAPAGAALAAAPRPMAQAQTASPQGVPMAAPGGPVLPPGVTPQQFGVAGMYNFLGNLRGKPALGEFEKIREYPLTVGIEEKKKQFEAEYAGRIKAAQEQAEADNARRKAEEKRIGEDPMIKVPFQNGTIEIPRSQYEALRKQRPDQFPDYGLLPGTPVNTGAPSTGIRPPVAGVPGNSGQAPIGEPNALTIKRDEIRQETDPFAFHYKPMVGQGPGQTEPIVRTPAPDHPSYSVIPPVSEFGGVRGSKTSIMEQQKKWPEIDQQLSTKSLGEIQKSQQIITTMADAFTRLHSGSFTEWQADVNKKLGTIGLWIPFTNNKAQDNEIISQYAFQNAIASLKGLGSMSNMELQGAKTAWANSQLEPTTAFSVLANDMGKLKQAEAFIQDRQEARKQGWIDPEAFFTKWHSMPENTLKNFVERAKSEIPRFKGMDDANYMSMLPRAATQPELDKLHLSPGAVFVGPDDQMHHVPGGQ